MEYGDLKPEFLLALHRESCNYGPMDEDSGRISDLLVKMQVPVSWDDHWQLMLDCMENAFKKNDLDLLSHILVTWVVPQGGACSALEACTCPAFFNFVYARCSEHTTNHDILTCLQNSIEQGENWYLTEHLVSMCRDLYLSSEDQETFNRIMREGIEQCLGKDCKGQIAKVLLRKGIYNMP